MGKKLTYWERSQRQAEKDRARRRASASRKAERQQKMRERERERAKIKAEREAEREARRREKQAEREAIQQAKQNEIDGWENEVQEYETYMETIVNLDKTVDIDLEDYSNREKTRTYTQGEYKPIPFKKKFIAPKFKPKTFREKKYKKKDDEYHFEYAFNWKKQNKIDTIIQYALAFFIFGYVDDPSSYIDWGASLIAWAIFPWWPYWHFRGAKQIEKVKIKNLEESEKRRKVTFEDGEKKRKTSFEKEVEEKKNQWEKEKEEFENSQKDRRAEFDVKENENEKLFEQNEKDRLEILSDAKNGDSEAVSLITEALLPLEYDIVPPSDFVDVDNLDHEVAYFSKDGKDLQILIHAPTIDAIVPMTKIEMTPARTKIKYSDIKESARNDIYDSFIAALAISNTKAIFTAMPFLNNISMEICIPGIDEATGKDIEQIILSVNFDNNTFFELNLDRISAKPALSNFQNKKEDKTDIDRDSVVWATDDDEGFALPYGLIQGQEETTINNKFGELKREDLWSGEHAYAFCCLTTSLLDGDIADEELDLSNQAVATLFDMELELAITTITESLKFMNELINEEKDIFEEYKNQMEIFFDYASNQFQDEQLKDFQDQALVGLCEVVYADGVLDEMEDKVVSLFYRTGGYSKEQLSDAIAVGELNASLKTGNKEKIVKALYTLAMRMRWEKALSLIEDGLFPEDANLDRVFHEDDHSYTVLSIAVMWGLSSEDPNNLKFIKLLIDKGASINQPSGDESSASKLQVLDTDMGKQLYKDGNGIKIKNYVYNR